MYYNGPFWNSALAASYLAIAGTGFGLNSTLKLLEHGPLSSALNKAETPTPPNLKYP